MTIKEKNHWLKKLQKDLEPYGMYLSRHNGKFKWGTSPDFHGGYTYNLSKSMAEAIAFGDGVIAGMKMSKEQKPKYLYPNQPTRREFQEKLIKFITEDLGCDLRYGDELLNYHGRKWCHEWTLNIELDDLQSEEWIWKGE